MLRKLLQKIGVGSGPDREADSLRQAAGALVRDDLVTAKRAAESIVAHEPGNVAAAKVLAEVHRRNGKPSAGVAVLDTALRRHSADVEALELLGNCLLEAGDRDQAIARLNQALRLEPSDVRLLLRIGLALLHHDDLQPAAGCFRKAMKLDPNSAEAHYNLGVVFQKAGKAAKALRSFEVAVGLDPALIAARANYALSLREFDRYEEALRVLREGLARTPENHELRRHLGVLLREAGEAEEAVAVLRRLARDCPEDGETWCLLAHALRDLGAFEECEGCLKLAFAINPKDPYARMQRAFGRLMQAPAGAGWEDYEARFETVENPDRGFGFPYWDGSPLHGKSVLVHAEQGLGDEIMFASCIPDLMRAAQRCAVECDPRLAEVFSRSFPGATILASERKKQPKWLEEIKPIDFQIAAGSLPRWFRRSLQDFPAHAAYLRADPARVEFWKARLRELGPGLKIGVSWRGGLGKTRQRIRSIGLAEWLPILRTGGCRFINLQYGESERDLTELRQMSGVDIVHWRDALADYAETAALVAALDLVVSVCTSIIHLAGALGRPLLVMVPKSPEWRYGRDGESMAWYPSARLIRQTDPADWAPVIRRAVEEIAVVTAEIGRQGAHSAGDASKCS